MNVNSNVSFKGVAPEVMQNFEKISRKARVNVAKHYDTLHNSESIDLIADSKGRLAIKIKQLLKGIIDGVNDLKENTIILMSSGTSAHNEGSEVVIKNLRTCDDKFINLRLDFGREKDARAITQEIDCNAGEFYADKNPILGVAIELSEKIRPLLEKQKEIMSSWKQG